MVKDFPIGTMDRNSVANARDMGPIPGPRGSYTQQATEDHVQQLLSPHTKSRALQGEKPPQWETCAVQQSSPHSLQRESPHTAAKTQHHQS